MTDKANGNVTLLPPHALEERRAGGLTSSGRLGAVLVSSRMTIVMLLVISVFLTIASWRVPNFYGQVNLQNNARRIAILSIYAIGGALPIIAAGIDLSVGSLIGLTGTILSLLLVGQGMPIAEALPLVLALGAALGLLHGVLVAKFNLPPFIVTLTGLLAYRSIARTLTKDYTVGFTAEHEPLRQLAIGFWGYVPIIGVIMLGIAVLVGIFLHGTVWGRHLYALGQNEEAARYSGVAVARLKIVAYTVSALLAAVAGILLALETNAIQPSDAGKSYELYGIAAAVLGGCSLRGGEGTVFGIIVGAAVLTILRNLIILSKLFPEVSTFVEDALIGAVLLGMVVIDEIVKRRAAGRA